MCKHEWKVLSETVTKSAIEVARSTVIGSIEFEVSGKLACAKRKHIQVFTCNKCGKLKRFVENI